MAPDWTIRAMRSEDVVAVSAIERDSFSDPWPDSAFQELLTVANRVTLVAIDPEDRLAGYLCAQSVADEIQIQNLAVATGLRRRGCADRLLGSIEAEGMKCGAAYAILDVRETNVAALTLYLGMGYRVIGRRRGYYRKPPGDALVLSKSLTRSGVDQARMEMSNGMVS
ncbi:MAG: ribosomal protein S18-alanine N-acetyltransferase [candidate division Zixibacteria bacterium]|nr:ribosomal protein S18-alanine N-acetyltransferase [candidate division Zixibacteria bacterium]